MASRQALAIAEFRYTSGLTGFLDVLDAQRTLLTAEVAESRTLLAQLVAVVQLYRALGGGWQTAPATEPPDVGREGAASQFAGTGSVETRTRTK